MKNFSQTKLILNAREAADLIGVPVTVLRQNMRSGIWKIGEVIPPKVKGGQTRYYIHRPMLERWLEGVEK